MAAEVHHTERVLLIEGDPGARAEVGSALRSAGHSVTSVAGGDEALAVLEDSGPTAVVADLRARLSDGRSVVDAIRAHPGSESVPILVLGDAEHAEEFQRLFQLGRVWYITRDAGWPSLQRTFDTMITKAEAGA